MVSETLLADDFVDTFVEPFDDSILNFADTFQIGEILLEFVSIWGHAF